MLTLCRHRSQANIIMFKRTSYKTTSNAFKKTRGLITPAWLKVLDKCKRGAIITLRVTATVVDLHMIPLNAN